MVSDGYWLRVPGHDWRRVRLEDYLNAAGNAGIYAQPSPDSEASLPPAHFVDIATGMTGTTVDPNTTPLGVGPPPQLTLEQAEVALATVYDLYNQRVYEMLEFMAKQLLSLGRHLEQIAQVYQPTQAGDGSRT